MTPTEAAIVRATLRDARLREWLWHLVEAALDENRPVPAVAWEVLRRPYNERHFESYDIAMAEAISALTTEVNQS